MSWPPAEDLLEPLAAWFDRRRRDLPWRAADLDAPHPDPYAVLVSELMLQQTQVATVVPYFLRWVERWPTAQALAQATEDDVHKAWEGLGYYRRARHLLAAARAVSAAGWPTDLAALPGLGPYTAAALGSIAFQRPEPALDGNAFRVLARLLRIDGDPRPLASDLRAWLSPALAAHGPSRLTQAIMELGALVCARRPVCAACPLEAACAARATGLETRIPAPRERAAVRKEAIWLLAVEAGGRWLLHPPSGKGLLAGLWRWPTLPLEAPGTSRAAGVVVPFGGPDARAWPPWTQVYSHLRETVHPVHVRLSTAPSAAGCRWIEGAELEALPMGRRDQRLRNLLDGTGQAATAFDASGLLVRVFA